MSTEPQNGEKEQRSHAIYERVSEKLSGFSPFFEFVVAVSAALTLTLLCFQTCYMSRSNQLTKESNENTVEANSKILGEMKRTNDLTSEALAQGREQFTTAMEQAERQFTTELEQGDAGAAVEQELTRQAIADSRRSFEIANRARLGIEEIDQIQLQEGVPFVARIKIRNTGKVPASNVRHHGRLEIHTAPFPEDRVRTFRLAREARADVGAGLPFAIVARIPALDKKTVEEIKSGKTPLYFFGTTTYDDGFGQQRTTGFCNVYSDNPDQPWKLCFGKDQNWED